MSARKIINGARISPENEAATILQANRVKADSSGFPVIARSEATRGGMRAISIAVRNGMEIARFARNDREIHPIALGVPQRRPLLATL